MGTDQSKSLRLYLADALQDAVANHTDPAQIKSLETQAELLRNPEQHVIVRDGRVRPAKFTDKHIVSRANHLIDAINDWSGGQAHIGDNIGWEDRSNQLPTKWHEDEEIDVPEDEHLPYGTQYVQNHKYDEPHNHHMHIAQLGDYLADQLNEVPDHDWTYHNEEQGTRLKRLSSTKRLSTLPSTRYATPPTKKSMPTTPQSDRSSENRS